MNLQATYARTPGMNVSMVVAHALKTGNSQREEDRGKTRFAGRLEQPVMDSGERDRQNALRFLHALVMG